MANFKAVMRLFKKFTQDTNESVMDSLYQSMFNQINISGITLDLDSTIMTRYGIQKVPRIDTFPPSADGPVIIPSSPSSQITA
jgi:hypothetical protein